MPKAQIAKWGNSLAVRIPKDVAEKAQMREGDTILVEALKGKVELRAAEKVPTLKELVAQITAESRYAEIASGPDQGQEIVEW